MQATGLWRFSFSGTAVGVGDGYLRLYIDGTRAAAMIIDPPMDYGGYYPISFTTINRVEIGSKVTVQFDGSSSLLDTDPFDYTHFVGEYLGDPTPALPECEYPGQTFQYPGSCRQYWFCQSDGTVDILDCCPDVYVPDAETCLSEDLIVVGEVCPADDTCT